MSGELGKAAKEPPGGVAYGASPADLRKAADDLMRLARYFGQVHGASSDSAFRFDAAPVEPASNYVIRHTRAPLPDPRLLRQIIRQRRLRTRFFDGDLFADPAWDMLLDLAAARAEHKRVSVTSLCIASGVPSTTALRWINVLTDAGLIERIEDDTDRRRAFLALTDRAADAMARYFAEIVAAPHLV